MKNIMTTLFLGMLVACTACTGGATSGGKGTTSPSKVIGPKEDTFSLSVPTLATKLKQGEAKAVTIGIKRAKSFGDDVKLKFNNLPQGVSCEPASPTIKADETEAKVTVKAADDAALGDFTVTVVGQPSKGADATSEFKITVEKK